MVKTYNEMAKSALSRISEYNDKVTERNRAAFKIVASTLCVAVAAALSIGVMNSGLLSKAPVSVTNGDNASAAVTSGEKTETGKTDTEKTESNGVIDIIGKTNESIEYSTIISYYGKSSYETALVVENGDVVFSESLSSAIDEYGDKVYYRVIVKLFTDGMPAGINAKIEASRLAGEGYTVAYELYTNGAESGELLTLHAKANQLKNFRADGIYGYYIVLYDELFPSCDAVGQASVFVE